MQVVGPTAHQSAAVVAAVPRQYKVADVRVARVMMVLPPLELMVRFPPLVFRKIQDMPVSSVFVTGITTV